MMTDHTDTARTSPLGKAALMVLLAAGLLAMASTAPAPASETCPNEALREAQHATFLPDCRAYEQVSPRDKLGTEVLVESSRTRAAAGEAPGLPAAVTFGSLGGFADVRGMGVSTEYMSQRDGTPGTSGWSAHAITPPQAPLTLPAILLGLEPMYQADMSDDLTRGVFLGWSPLTDAPNVAHVSNLYLRQDLRSPGAGTYQLLSDASSLLPATPALPFGFIFPPRENAAATSADLQHVLFETKQNLTPDATGRNVKLYLSDGGEPRLVSAGPACPGGATAEAPCSAAGQGAFAFNYTQRTLSSDGTRAIFTSPLEGIGNVLDTSGAASKLYQLDDRGTGTTADDTILQLDASEVASPGPTQAARFQTASTDGSRVFFISAEQLTDAPGAGLYMWARQPVDEVQSVTLDATGGTFALTAHAQPSHGDGTLVNGSTDVEGVTGSFSVGQTISGAGIPGGTTIADVPSSTSLTLSQPATADGDTALAASVDATTVPLPSDATAAQVQSALEGLSTIGTGNVSVSGGPGGAGGASPYVVTFTGALAGVDVAQLSADGGALTGGGASATVATTTPVRNLTLIAPIAGGSPTGTIGASADGHRLYFASADGQLVSGAPPVQQDGIYSWEDTDGRPGGTLSFVGGIAAGDMPQNVGGNWNGAPNTARVTPDGRTLVFEASDGSGLKPRYDQTTQCLATLLGNPNGTGGGCSEVYVYRADSSTPTDPDLVCASCNPSGAPGTSSAWINIRRSAGGSGYTTHLSRALSDDGRYVFFSTAEALVPEDTNGKFDAYEYDTTDGSVHLLSSGADTSDSYFLDASASGHDVYFVTRQQLVGWDTDSAYDLYDARVGGGFPDPLASVECRGEACHGPAGAAPSFELPFSATLSGAGNSIPAFAVAPSSGPRPITRKQKLARALRLCHHKPNKAKRKTCERQAERRYK
jgi:hypothetical protein